jgi:hypothetical protein
LTALDYLSMLSPLRFNGSARFFKMLINFEKVRRIGLSFCQMLIIGQSCFISVYAFCYPEEKHIDSRVLAIYMLGTSLFILEKISNSLTKSEKIVAPKVTNDM